MRERETRFEESDRTDFTGVVSCVPTCLFLSYISYILFVIYGKIFIFIRIKKKKEGLEKLVIRPRLVKLDTDEHILIPKGAEVNFEMSGEETDEGTLVLAETLPPLNRIIIEGRIYEYTFLRYSSVRGRLLHVGYEIEEE